MSAGDSYDAILKSRLRHHSWMLAVKMTFSVAFGALLLIAAVQQSLWFTLGALLALYARQFMQDMMCLSDVLHETRELELKCEELQAQIGGGP